MFGKWTYTLWAWISTIALAILIYELAQVPFLTATADATNEAVKVIFRMVLYALLFILLFRSIIATLKNSVGRLSKWRSKREEFEDAEFVLIIETLVVIITLLATILFAIFEEYTQTMVSGRAAELKDVLVSVMACLLTAIVVYTVPVIGELEVAIKQKLFPKA